MKKHICLLLLLCVAFSAQAQNVTLSNLNLKQDTILRTGVLVLGGWAILNIMLGSFKLSTTTRARRYFHQMNLYWNIVNLLIAAIALHGIVSAAAAPVALAESVRQHMWYKKILYLNVGLDVSYMAVGAYLRQRAATAAIKAEQYEGWGQSLVLQGLFLFLLDLVLVVMLEQNTDAFFSLIPKL